MVAQSTQPYTHAALYSATEAALYARLTPTTLRRWLSGSERIGPLIKPTYVDSGDERFLNFTNLIEAVNVRELRAQSIPMQAIRKAIDRFYEDYKHLDHPFARRHEVYTLGRDLYIKLPDEDDPRKLVSPNRGQMGFRPFMSLVARDIDFDEATGLANSYRAFRWNDVEIKMTPGLRYGEPVVMSCGLTARTLWEAAITEGSIESAAKAYDVTCPDVEAAVRYFDHLTGIAA